MPCENCRYAEGEEGSKVLECHLHPPVVAWTDEGWKQGWPLVTPTDWCGEARPKEWAEGVRGKGAA